MANTAKAFQHENGVLFTVGATDGSTAQYIVNKFGGIRLIEPEPTAGLEELPWDGSLALLIQSAISGTRLNIEMSTIELSLLGSLVVEKIEDFD